MELGLKGKVAIVTGSGSQIGYGKGIALVLAREGCDVVVADIVMEGAKQTAAEIEALGRKSLAAKVDISNTDEVAAMVKAALDKFGKIDILVNNAGSTTPPKPFKDITNKEWDSDINVNLKGVFNCTKAVLNHMLSRKSGKIVNISSPAGLRGRPMMTIYSAAKAGVIAFTQALAAEVGPSGINVNSVSPGLGATGFAKFATQEFLDRMTKEQITGRLTLPQDMGNMVAYLASDVSSHIVGQNIGVMGKVA